MAQPQLLDGTGELSLEEVAAPEALATEWARLAEESGNVFGTWEWLSLWWRHYGGGRELRVVACRSADGKLVAILPLYMWLNRRRLRIARFLGHGPGDELGPVCASRHRELAAAGLSRVAGEWGAHLVVADRLPGDTDWRGLLGGRTLEREGSPRIRFESDSWEDFLATKSRNFRQQTGKHRRRLEGRYETRFRLVDREGLERGLDDFFALHLERWAGAHSDFAGPDRPFQHDFAVRASELGWLRLWLVDLDGKPAAAAYVLRFAGIDGIYQTGRDPAYSKERIGQILLAHVVRDAVEAGIGEFRLLRGDQEHKQRYATSDPGVESIGVAAGRISSAALTVGVQLRRRRALWRGALRTRGAPSEA
jgi:CelD/BcsL family acetyltransferase involved in cellulose biosynthesis